MQIFDSWASQLSPQDFDVFSAPYIKQIIEDVRKVLLLFFQRPSNTLAVLRCGTPEVSSMARTSQWLSLTSMS